MNRYRRDTHGRSSDAHTAYRAKYYRRRRRLSRVLFRCYCCCYNNILPACTCPVTSNLNTAENTGHNHDYNSKGTDRESSSRRPKIAYPVYYTRTRLRRTGEQNFWRQLKRRDSQSRRPTVVVLKNPNRAASA